MWQWPKCNNGDSNPTKANRSKPPPTCRAARKLRGASTANPTQWQPTRVNGTSEGESRRNFTTATYRKRRGGKPNDSEANPMTTGWTQHRRVRRVAPRRRKWKREEEGRSDEDQRCITKKQATMKKSWPVFRSSIFSFPPTNLLHLHKAETTPTATNGCSTTTNPTRRASAVNRPKLTSAAHRRRGQGQIIGQGSRATWFCSHFLFIPRT